MQNRQIRRLILGLFLGYLAFNPEANAGVHNAFRFVAPGQFAVALEPELTLTDGAGIGANLKFTHGLNDLTNATAIIGTGGGSRRFRAGAQFTMDFFPDTDGQPGLGIATQGIYYRQENLGRSEFTLIPYIHKAFDVRGGEVEPFFALPYGVAFVSGHYNTISNVAVGAMFKSSEHIRYTLELGVAINNTDSYMSGGLTYYY